MEDDTKLIESPLNCLDAKKILFLLMDLRLYDDFMLYKGLFIYLDCGFFIQGFIGWGW
jgi:hypothetical protein